MKNANKWQGGKKDKMGKSGTHLAHELSLTALLAEKGVILGEGLLSFQNLNLDPTTTAFGSSSDTHPPGQKPSH